MERLPAAPSFVGIDVSKDRLDVHLRPSGRAFAVTRDGKGLEQLVDDLRTLAPASIVLEATGGFEIVVAAALAGAALPVSVVNPRQIRDFAREQDGSPRPTRLMPKSSPCSLNASVPNHAQSPTLIVRPWPS